MILTFIASLWLVVPLYMLLHEGGHALVAASFGAKIVEVNLLDGYVISEGGHMSQWNLSFFYSAGLLIPLMAFTVYLSFYRKATQNNFYKMVSALFAIRILFSIGVWGIVPIKYMLGAANMKDDVVQIIQISNIHPVIIILIACLLLSIYITCIWRKQIFQNAYKMLKSQ